MFLLIQNDPQCPPGTCLEPIIAAGQPYTSFAAYLDQPFPDPAQFAGVIVLGGEMGVHETERFPYLDRVRDFMTRALQAGTPLLGICLGGQLLAQVAGGTVASPSSHGEKGICRVGLTTEGAADPLFTGLPDPFVTFQLHDDSFSLPPDATLLARSAACPAQAFRLGARAYGVQFHPEVDCAIVGCWERMSQPALDLLPGFRSAQTAFDAASQAILTNFISLALAARLP
jgi:GMP synthase (glutamine-hydrolysing)